MQIAGLQKVTLVDFPGVVAATVFTRGCSFRCPFCHNPELVLPDQFSPLLEEDEIINFFESRKGKLQGVCITGGEPLMHGDIGLFVKKIKNIGLKVKLDSNGSFPDKLEKLIKEGNLDYIAMDIKSSLMGYGGACGVKSSTLNEKMQKSIKMIMDSGVDYEFRTTVCHPLHSVNDFFGIGELIRGANKYYIQNFVSSKHVDGEAKFEPFSEKELNQAMGIMQEYVILAQIR